MTLKRHLSTKVVICFILQIKLIYFNKINKIRYASKVKKKTLLFLFTVIYNISCLFELIISQQTLECSTGMFLVYVLHKLSNI